MMFLRRRWRTRIIRCLGSNKRRKDEAMEFITAAAEHIDRMCEITDQAKAQLRALGLDQWQKGYPGREVWLQDIRERCAYLAAENGEIQIGRAHV